MIKRFGFMYCICFDTSRQAYWTWCILLIKYYLENVCVSVCLSNWKSECLMVRVWFTFSHASVFLWHLFLRRALRHKVFGNAATDYEDYEGRDDGGYDRADCDNDWWFARVPIFAMWHTSYLSQPLVVWIFLAKCKHFPIGIWKNDKYAIQKYTAQQKKHKLFIK